MRHSFVALVISVLWVVGCSSGGSGGGCASLAPIPNGRYAGPKSDNVVNVRLSPNGVNYLNNNWQTLVDAFAPGRTLNIPVACTMYNAPLVGDLAIADQGGPSGGQLDHTCDGRDVPLSVPVVIESFSLIPRAPDTIDGDIRVSINTGKIYIDSVDQKLFECAWLSGLKISVAYNTAASGSPQNGIKASIKFSINQKWDKMLSFDVTNLDGTGVCGASGASGQPYCFDPSDLSLNGENNCGSIYMGILDWNPIKTFILQQISPMVQSQVKTAVAAQSCWACDATTPCPTINGNVSTCQNKVCMDPATSTCVPRFLGVEGRLGLGAFLGSFGAPADAAMDLTVFAGSSVKVDTGISLGTRGGLQAVKVAPCVVAQAPPAMTAVSPPDFDGEAPPPDPTRGQYHAGVGISSPFINMAMHEAQQSGALCLSLTTATVGLVNTGLFKTFLPSLGKLATRDLKDAPMMIVLRPARPPAVTVGLGTYDPVTKKPLKPLLLIEMQDLSIDFYAQIDDRYARLFTLTADISLPLSLIFEGCDKVTPAIGDLKSLITNIRTANSEMLAEDPKVLADLVPAVVGLAEPALAGALKPFQLPSLGQFKLQISGAKGVGNIAGTEAYNHLGIFAYLLPANATCAVSAPITQARLVRSVMPVAEEMRLRGKKLRWPEAVLNVEALSKPGSPEFSTKVDDGLWSDFIAAPGGELVVSHPVFLLQGVHKIEVRARVAEDPHGISNPVSVGFTVDWEPPELRFTVDRDADRLVLAAHDQVSPLTSLQYAYAVGKGAFSDFGPERPISLSAVEAQGGVTVRVKDELGNVGELAWRAPTIDPRAGGQPAASVVDAPAAAGCSTAGGLELFALTALAGLLRRRRR